MHTTFLQPRTAARPGARGRAALLTERQRRRSFSVAIPPVECGAQENTLGRRMATSSPFGVPLTAGAAPRRNVAFLAGEPWKVAGRLQPPQGRSRCGARRGRQRERGLCSQRGRLGGVAAVVASRGRFGGPWSRSCRGEETETHERHERQSSSPDSARTRFHGHAPTHAAGICFILQRARRAILARTSEGEGDALIGWRFDMPLQFALCRTRINLDGALHPARLPFDGGASMHRPLCSETSPCIICGHLASAARQRQTHLA